MPRPDWRRPLVLQHWASEHIQLPHAERPDDWPEYHRLRTAGIFPAYCGDHAPGLTGVYALLNSFKLLLAEVSPLQPADERMLLEIAWGFMNGRATIAPHIGIRQHILVRMGEAMSFALFQRRGSWVCLEALHASSIFRTNIAPTLEKLLVSRHVVLVLLGRGHYTVLHGYTPASWLLFDATGRQWMLRQPIGRARTFKAIMSFSRAS